MRANAIVIVLLAPALIGGCASCKRAESTAAEPVHATAQAPGDVSPTPEELERRRKLVNRWGSYDYDGDNPFEE